MKKELKFTFLVILLVFVFQFIIGFIEGMLPFFEKPSYIKSGILLLLPALAIFLLSRKQSLSFSTVSFKKFITYLFPLLFLVWLIDFSIFTYPDIINNINIESFPDLTSKNLFVFGLALGDLMVSLIKDGIIYLLSFLILKKFLKTGSNVF